jgi:hypothetical protein
MESGKAQDTENIIPEVLKVDTETSIDICTHYLKRYGKKKKFHRNGKKA